MTTPGSAPPHAAVSRIIIALVAAAALLAVSPAAAAAWRRPVPGAVSRPFAYSPAAPFAAGRHRGADFSAPAGAVVRAACAGRVAFAGRGVVTLRCGPWRVTHLPLATLRVRAGERVREGASLGTLAPSREHAGLHLGVRRAGDEFAYVDPVPLLTGAAPDHDRRPPPPPAHRVAARRSAPGVAARRSAPGARLRPAPQARLRAGPGGGSSPRGSAGGAWPVWIGLALVLAGAAGGGFRVRVRRRQRAREAVACAP